MLVRSIVSFMLSILLFSCNNNKQQGGTQISKEDQIVNNLMLQCRNFDTNEFILGLPGEWIEDSSLVYDENWQQIDHCNKLMGEWYVVGGSGVEKYIFCNGGKGSYLSYGSSLGPLPEEYAATFEWDYNIETKELAVNGVITSGELKGGPYNFQYLVSGYNGQYLILDYNITVYDQFADKYISTNIRKIYKKNEL
jgi:hypothetical protein